MRNVRTLVLVAALSACGDESSNTVLDAGVDAATGSLDGSANDAATSPPDASIDATVVVDAANDAASDASTGTDAAVVPEAFLQYWTGEWGQLVLRQVGDEVWGVYSHDEGTVRGTIVGNTFTGWWCEVPSRLPPSDAGDVIFDFVLNEDGETYRIDGRWRYASEIPDGSFRENWDLDSVSTEAPEPTLLARFDDPTAFCLAP